MFLPNSAIKLKRKFLIKKIKTIALNNYSSRRRLMSPANILNIKKSNKENAILKKMSNALRNINGDNL